MSDISYENLLKELQERKYSFGQSLRFIREDKKMKIRKIANEVNKTATYISDIERGNNKPPEKELMEKIFDALELQSMEIKCYLYDLAAIERGRVSLDIAEYIMENSNLRDAIRLVQRKNIIDPGSGDKFWAECLSNMQT